MAENLHLIQFISQTSLVTPDFLCIKTFFNLSVMNRQIFKNSVDNFFTQENHVFSVFKKLDIQNFFKSAY